MQQTITHFIEHERERTYFTLPFTMPPDIDSMTLQYRYDRHLKSETQVGDGMFSGRNEANIIDLGLIAPDGTQIGASGSDKNEIHLSETDATPGYRPCALVPGEWQILVGAYKVASEGVTVTYELSFTRKKMQLLKGDLHTHTLASDGVLTAEELARHALRHGLDFVAITDHNQMVSADALPRIPGITLIPGVEWTHYNGHANFLGVDQPYDGTFATNTEEEARSRFISARDRGAVITINHPFYKNLEFRFDIQSLPFDCLEVWNGPMQESNLRAIGYWQSLLVAGKKIPICGGSDYHRSTPFLFLGGPTTCVFAKSASPSDILSAVRQGHSYIIFSPDGPSLEFTSGGALPGDTVAWPANQTAEITADGLLTGDVVRIITQAGEETLLQASSNGQFKASYTMKGPGFARVEILRSFLPGILPMLPALLSNPIYFDETPES